MFKLISRIISLIMFLIIVIAALAFWKGGEPFRVLGEGMVIAGEEIQIFGNLIDEMKEGGEKVGEQLKEMKETLDTLKESPKEQEKPESSNGTVNKDKESE